MINHPTLILLVVILLTACVEKHSSDGKSVQVGLEQKVVMPINATAIPVDLEKSFIHWKGTKMKGMGKHEGDLTLEEGQLFVKNDQVSGGYFVADMQSITVTDIPDSDPIPKRNLTNHLKDEDFFAVHQYPTTHFEITKVESFAKDSLLIRGNLTIKDITRSIAFKAQQQVKTRLFTAAFSFNRFDWNIAFQGSLVDRLVVDPAIELKIKLFY